MAQADTPEGRNRFEHGLRGLEPHVGGQVLEELDVFTGGQDVSNRVGHLRVLEKAQEEPHDPAAVAGLQDFDERGVHRLVGLLEDSAERRFVVWQESGTLPGLHGSDARCSS